MNNIIECNNLCKRYGAVQALNDINLSIESGQIIGLLGPNGSGKTTLIKLITGLLRPSHGEVLVDGMVPGKESKAVVSYLPERNALPKNMSVKALVNMYKDFFTDFSEGKAYNMLNDLNIDIKLKLKSLSKGNIEKVQLILAMSREAKLYVLDEPIGGVDPAARDYILKTILTNYSEGSAVIISTHLIQDIENVLDRAVFIQNGNLRLNMSVDDMREQFGKSVDEYFREVYRC